MVANLTPHVANVHALPDTKLQAIPSNGSWYKAEKLQSTSSKVPLTIDWMHTNLQCLQRMCVHSQKRIF